MRLGICYTLVSAENKMLLDSARKRGVELERIVDSEAVLQITDKGVSKGAGGDGANQQVCDRLARNAEQAEHREERSRSPFDAILQRSVSYSRSLYINYFYEKSGTEVINSYRSARICGDKMICSMELAKAGVLTPKTYITFSPEATKKAAAKLGFPFVIKPVMGSWARMIHRINDRDSLEAAIESREEMGGPWQKIYYLQEHINKPGRDIRAFVVGDKVIAAIYRHSTEKSGWITNTGRGGIASNCPVTPELTEVCLKAASIVDEGIYGVDLMESERGLLVHEINHTTEFRNSSPVTGVDIGDKMIEYLISRAKR